jgi:hypothetical protein
MGFDEAIKASGTSPYISVTPMEVLSSISVMEPFREAVPYLSLPIISGTRDISAAIPEFADDSLISLAGDLAVTGVTVLEAKAL